MWCTSSQISSNPNPNMIPWILFPCHSCFLFEHLSQLKHLLFCLIFKFLESRFSFISVSSLSSSHCWNCRFFQFSDYCNSSAVRSWCFIKKFWRSYSWIFPPAYEVVMLRKVRRLLHFLVVPDSSKSISLLCFYLIVICRVFVFFKVLILLLVFSPCNCSKDFFIFKRCVSFCVFPNGYLSIFIQVSVYVLNIRFIRIDTKVLFLTDVSVLPILI